ncbi:MAG: hypothetical protein ACI92S_004168, partial [Planctomycetaceae bacterium]
MPLWVGELRRWKPGHDRFSGDDVVADSDDRLVKDRPGINYQFVGAAVKNKHN